MRGVRPLFLALIVPLLAAAFSACGGSSEKLIPPANAAALIQALQQVEDLASAGNCDTAGVATEQVLQQVNDLPDSVDEGLKENLIDGTTRLRQLTEDQATCQSAPPPETETTQTQTTETVTEPPTVTETTPTETVPPDDSGGTPPDGGVGPETP